MITSKESRERDQAMKIRKRLDSIDLNQAAGSISTILDELESIDGLTITNATSINKTIDAISKASGNLNLSESSSSRILNIVYDTTTDINSSTKTPLNEAEPLKDIESSTQWRVLTILAELVVAQRLARLLNILDDNGDRLIHEIIMSETAAPSHDKTQGLCVSFKINGEGGLIPIKVFTPDDLAQRLVAEDDKLLSRASNDLYNEIMFKQAVEFLGMDDLTLDSVTAYSASQHEAVLSNMAEQAYLCSTLSANNWKGDPEENYDQLDDGDKRAMAIIDATLMGLMYRNSNGKMKINPQIRRLDLQRKIDLIRAVSGSCRFRDGNGLYDADYLSAMMTWDYPLGLDYTLRTDDNGRSYPVTYSASLDKFIFHRDGRTEWREVNGSWIKVNPWSTCMSLVNQNDPSPGSIVQILPDDLRKTVTLDRLKRLESLTRALDDYFFMESWGEKCLNAVKGLSAHSDRDSEVDVIAQCFLFGDKSISVWSGDLLSSEEYDDERLRWLTDMTQLAIAVDGHRHTSGDPFGSLTLVDIVILLSVFCVMSDQVVLDLVGTSRGGECAEALDRAVDSLKQSRVVHEHKREVWRWIMAYGSRRYALNGSDKEKLAAGLSLYCDLMGGDVIGDDSWVGHDQLARTLRDLNDVMINVIMRRLTTILGTDEDGLNESSYPVDFIRESLAMRLQDDYDAIARGTFRSSMD